MMSELTMRTPQALEKQQFSYISPISYCIFPIRYTEKQQFSYISKNLVIIYTLVSVKRDWELKLSLVFRSQTSSTLINSELVQILISS